MMYIEKKATMESNPELLAVEVPGSTHPQAALEVPDAQSLALEPAFRRPPWRLVTGFPAA